MPNCFRDLLDLREERLGVPMLPAKTETRTGQPGRLPVRAVVDLELALLAIAVVAERGQRTVVPSK